MPNNDLRTKVTDLPICTDIEQLDTILGIGKDNAMYRVDSENIGGGGKWEPLTLNLTSNHIAEIDQTEINNAFTTGGKIHILAVNDIGSLVDFDLIISSTYITPQAEVEDAEVEAFEAIPNNIKYISKFEGIDNNKLLYTKVEIDFFILNTYIEIHSFLIDLNDNTSSNEEYIYKIIGAFFEPIKNIGDLSKVNDISPR